MYHHRARTPLQGLFADESMHPLRRRLLVRDGRQHRRRVLVHHPARRRPGTARSHRLLVPRLPGSPHHRTRARASQPTLANNPDPKKWGQCQINRQLIVGKLVNTMLHNGKLANQLLNKATLTLING